MGRRAGLAPLTSSERMGELDVLRGFALLAVFVVHFVGASYYGLPMDAALRNAWATDPVQFTTVFLSDWLFENKGNTLFATLFGMGFWVMMERLEARGNDFRRIYLRRLAALLLIGAAHLFLIFPMDVLHEYALLGFALYFLRWMPKSVMLSLGLTLAIFGEFIGAHIAEALTSPADGPGGFREVFESGSYGAWLAWFPGNHLRNEIAGMELLGWALYVFGRFLLGAWIIRMGWVQRSAELLPQMRKICLVAVPLGLAVELLSLLQWMDLVPKTNWSSDALHELGGPILAIGYSTGLILLFHSKGRRLAQFFAPVGRTALTAYVAHGIVWTLAFFPLGLGLQGTVPPIAWMAFALGLFAAFRFGANWWLARFRYGPLEYLWRWATYGKRPDLVRTPSRLQFEG